MALLNDIRNRIRNFWEHITTSQRVLVAVLATLVIAAFFGLIIWLNSTEMQTLYTKLSPEDANRVVQSLEKDNVPYKLVDNGASIMVPADKVYGLRIKIAGEGNLTGKGIGLEKFDENAIGVTDFVQKVNYQRALQGELTRTISEFPNIESARVHLVMPRSSLFIEDQKKPSASIVVKMLDGKKMDQKEVMAIVNLVAMSVEDLTKERIAVTDVAGHVLYQPEEAGSMNGMSNSQYEHKLVTQQHLENRIEELLMPIAGAGRVMAKVNVELDFSHKTISRTLYDPEKTVLLSQSRTERTTQGRAALEGGVPEANFRGDGLNGTTSNAQSSEEQRVENYATNKEEQNIVAAVGDIHRITVAVAVDGTYTTNDKGEKVFTPRTEEELKSIKQLVAQAVGFDSARGDTIEVTNIPFGAPLEFEERSMVDTVASYAVRLGKPLLNSMLILLFLLLIVRPVVMALIRPKVEGEVMEGFDGLPMGEERLALIDNTEEELDAMAILEKIEDIKAHALHLSEQNMDQAVSIIRSWIKPAMQAKAA